MKVNDLIVLDNIYNVENNKSNDVARLLFFQKYITLEYEGVLYNLELVSVDDFEFIVKVEGCVDDGRV